MIGNPGSPLVRARGVVGKLAGHEIYWFSPQQADIPEVRSLGLPQIVSKMPVLSNLAQFLIFGHIVKAVQPDLIHVHYASKGLLSVALARFHPLVVTAMGSDISPTVAYRGIYAAFTRRLLESADCITVKSTYMLEMLNRIGDFSEKTEIIRWGVDPSLFRPDRATEALRKKKSIPKNALVFWDPRAARPLYNKHVLVEAFSKYLELNGPEAVLLVSSFNAAPNYLRGLQAKVNALGLEEKIRFVSRLQPKEMADFYALADVVVSVPSSDGFPQTIYEAWASGCFLVLGNLPQYRAEIEDELNAKLVAVGDVEGLAKAMIWAAEHPEVRQNAAKINRARILDIANKDQESQKVINIYRRLLVEST